MDTKATIVRVTDKKHRFFDRVGKIRTEPKRGWFGRERYLVEFWLTDEEAHARLEKAGIMRGIVAAGFSQYREAIYMQRGQFSVEQETPLIVDKGSFGISGT